MRSVKQRVFEVVQTAQDGDVSSKIFDFCMIALIIINMLFVILDTFSLPYRYQIISKQMESLSVFVFTVEYALRLWTAELLYPQYPRWKARFKYIFSLIALIDLFSILPFYIPFAVFRDLRILRVLRIVRLFRIFKLSRYTNALQQISAVFRKKFNQLFSSMFVVFLLMIIASIMMYHIENPAQPDVFNNAFSGLWWAIATLTTVGYGDIYPITTLGKILSAIIALLGIGLVAVPTGIVSAGFMEQIDQDVRETGEKHFCPYCGKKLD